MSTLTFRNILVSIFANQIDEYIKGYHFFLKLGKQGKLKKMSGINFNFWKDMKLVKLYWLQFLLMLLKNSHTNLKYIVKKKNRSHIIKT